MVIACGVACAVFGGAQAMPGDAETTATVSTKMRVRREGVEEVLDRVRQQEYLSRSIALGDEKECEDVRFKVNLPVGGRVSVRLREENGKERSISFEESGAQFACLNLDRPTEMHVVGSPKRDARGDFELHVESVDGQTLLLSDQKGPTNALSYAKITKSFADDADLSATLGKELGSCENVVFTTGFAREAGVSRRIEHKLYADTGVLVSEWKSHSNGEKKLCLIRGASYHLQISGETSYGSTRNRVAIRVSKDEAPSQDGYVYALASSNSLLRDYSTVYFASTDETRDSMYMSGRYTFHIPSDCPVGQAQLSVLLTSATYGDGVPPQGMSWMIRDSEGREVTTMASPFEAGDLGVTKHQMVCVSSGDYEFIAVASDKRGWNYGPELKLFQKWHGKPRQLLLAKGGDIKSRTPYTVEAPWFSSSMVSEPIKFEVRIGQEQSALGSTYEAPRSFANAVAALGKSKVAAGASIGLPAVICASVAAFAVFALVRGESSADANVKQSLVGDAQIAAYGTGEANDRVEDKRLKSNRQRSHQGALKILAVSSSLLAAVFAKSDPSKIKSIPVLGMASPSTGRANCGMGITTCKVLHAPDCTSHSMYTYREGKLAHAPLFITPYNATALHGKPRIHMELDASSCARSDTAVCSDLGRTRADSLKECSTTCRNTEGCRAFSFEEDKCQLCSDEGSIEREGSVASITRCMDPYEFSFTDITQDQCAGACDKTKMCHAFNYFDGWADVPSHCELLQLPAALKAHVWTESSNTKNGLAGAATYYKVNSDRMCNPRGEAPVLPDLPAGLGYHVSIEVPSKGYYANFPYPSEDSYPDESEPHEYPDNGVTDGYPDDSVADEEPQKEEQRRSESIDDQYIVSSAVVLDAFTTSSFDDNERQAFVDGLASFTDSQVEDVIIVSTRSIVGVQSKRAALEIHFVVLAPSESKAKLTFDLLADAEREQGSDQDLINQLVRAGLRSVSVAVISEKPFVTDPQQRLEPEDPKYDIDDDKYIAISGRMTLDGYTVGGMNDKAIDILTNSMGEFFTVGASNSAVVSIHHALKNVTSSSKAVTFSYMLATKKVALAEDITEALIFMRDRGSAQAKNFVRILQFRGLSAVSFVEAFGSPKLELTSEVNTNLTRVVTKTVTKTVDVVSCETKLTGYSAESFTDDLQDGFREALANFLSRSSSQPLSVDSIRIISVRNGSGERAVKEQAMLGLGAASSGSVVIDYEIVVDEEEEAAKLEGALQQLSGGSTNDTETSSSTQANDTSVDAFTSDLISSGLTEVTEVSSEPPQTSEQSFLQTIEEAIQISHDDNDGAGDNDTAPRPGFHSDYPSSNDYPTDSSDAASEAYRITSSIVFDGYTLATFDVSANMAFRAGVSTYLGIDFSDILITGLSTHLLSGDVVQLGAPSAGIEVSFTAQVESSEMAKSVVGALNDISNNPAASSELRTELTEAGLEVTQVAVVEKPTIVNHSSYPSGYPAPSSSYPASPNASTVPGESSTVPGESSTIPGGTSAYPAQTSTVPGESSTIVPGSTSEVPEDFSAYPGDTSTVPGESSTIVPGSTSEVPEDFNAYPGDTSTVPGERNAYPGGDEETVYVVSSTCRVEGIDLGSFDAEAKNQFRSGIAAFLGIATKQVSVVAVAPITISGNRRLLQTPALDIEFMTRSTASAVANAIANEINAAVTQNNVALMQHLQQAGLNIINAAMQTQATVTQSTSSQSTPATPTPSAPSGPTAGPIDINLNVNVDLNVHEDLPAPSSSSAYPTPSPSSTTSAYPVPDSNTPASAYPTSQSDVPVADSSYPVLADDSVCVQSGSETDLSMYDEEGSLHQSALEEAQSFALANNLTIPDADVFVRAKVCNEPHMKCCSSLGWRQDNMRRFPYVCGAAVGCQNAHFRDAKRMCTRAGGDLCRGNAVTTSADDPACPGSKTHYVWTLTRCNINGVEGRVIRPSGGGSPGPLCEINLNTEHQVRCCSNVC